ncbi:hypothetical protein B0O99DRAFT_166480 [Bisporella sp. PMI_857]|nr:hypothetical protein B0O99DRAFT_166480 [Bisporella sp. PMI_857]
MKTGVLEICLFFWAVSINKQRKGIIATDVISKFGMNIIAGSTLLDRMPYRSMYPQIAHPVAMALIPELLSNELVGFAATVLKFVYSCVVEEFGFPEEDRLAWIGGVALMVCLPS